MGSRTRILVVGSGPAGLASAAGLGGRGLDVRLVDRDARVGGAYTRIWPEMMLSSPTSLIGLPGLALAPRAAYIPAGAYREYLEGYARAYDLVPERAEVVAMESLGHGYRVALATADGGGDDGERAVSDHEFDAVIVATGLFDHPVWPDIEGLARGAGGPTIMHACQWRGADGLAVAPGGRTVLIIGAAISGVEIAEAAARAGARVLVSARGGVVKLMPRALLGRDLTGLFMPWVARLPALFSHSRCEYGFTARGLDLGFRRLRARGAIEVRPELSRLCGARAEFVHGPPAEVDVVIAATGYGHAMPFLPDDVALTTAGHPRTRDCQSVSHPGLYFVGTPCARSLASQYLYGMGRDAWHVARTLARP